MKIAVQTQRKRGCDRGESGRDARRERGREAVGGTGETTGRRGDDKEKRRDDKREKNREKRRDNREERGERGWKEGHRNTVVGVKKKKSGMEGGGKRRTEMDLERETENRAGRKRAIPRDVTRSGLHARGRGNQMTKR